ncbi:MAG: response regulator [Pirellulales bacterium]|nr:response regulator [Pirellulales bacterium]
MSASLPSILITDDDRTFRESLLGVFTPDRYRTLQASDGEEALSIVGRDTVHLLILDHHMPRLSGLETLRRMRQLRWWVPCILISASADEELVRQALAERAFLVLSKPISGRAIASAVERALRDAYNWPACELRDVRWWH